MITLPGWAIVAMSFALGGLLGGHLLGWLRGVDLRTTGSGNVGTTNALRTQGKGFALLVLIVDAGKGAVAALLLPRLGPELPTLPYACAAAAVMGHCFSPWHGFNGGKGVATLAGVTLALLPKTFICMLASFVLTILLTGIVSVATLMGALVALLYVTCYSPVGVFSPSGAFLLAMVVLVLVTHRDNWRRLWNGVESRFESARLLGRALQLPTLGVDKPKP
jgi:acyl phosphate:glycerol-3-phosphate acyltransferase